MISRIVKFRHRHDIGSAESFKFRFVAQVLVRKWWCPWKLSWKTLQWSYSHSGAMTYLECYLSERGDSAENIKYGIRNGEIIKVEL